MNMCFFCTRGGLSWGKGRVEREEGVRHSSYKIERVKVSKGVAYVVMLDIYVYLVSLTA
jgi:hypothetical protein